jgi:hypothetical protein
MNRWNVSAAIDTYNKALKVQEDALAKARARLEAFRAACRTSKRNGGGADAERGAHGDTGETEKNKLIAALMRDTSLSKCTCRMQRVCRLSFQRCRISVSAVCHFQGTSHPTNVPHRPLHALARPLAPSSSTPPVVRTRTQTEETIVTNKRRQHDPIDTLQARRSGSLKSMPFALARLC